MSKERRIIDSVQWLEMGNPLFPVAWADLPELRLRDEAELREAMQRLEQSMQAKELGGMTKDDLPAYCVEIALRTALRWVLKEESELEVR